MTYGACGFNNNGIGIYTSADLSNTGWKLETLNALPAATRAVGEYWEPNMVWNAATRKFVMWWIYSKPNTTLGVVQVGVSASRVHGMLLWAWGQHLHAKS